MSLEYISYEDYKMRGFPLEKIEEFDCGDSNFNSFLSDRLVAWQENLAGITYFLIDTEDEKIEIDDCIPMLCEITDEMMYLIF